MRTPSFRHALLRVSPVLLMACTSYGPAPRQDGDAFRLLRCPPVRPAAAEATVDSAGDEITVRGHTFHLRPGSVTQITGFRVTDRADGYVGVEIEPDSTEFAVPAVLTLSYARCGNAAAGFRNLQVVEVGKGDTVIVDSTLDGVWNRRGATITVHIEHLSGYLIGGT